ncbi:MAG: energy transducer TonB [Candidatus Eisenbacteria bacterium]|uniref:Energy transducer TonB n=1 Tax=Eiseniibacteriota bacterium TaxID=2212470 RepID=A0A849SIQ8_UNCEI|nr:energy transducer TonB [Candidatus Eisenbacteria bacterium]
MVQALVFRDGSVAETRVVRSIPMLDDAAVDCVRQWRFTPGMTNGEPVAVWVTIPIKFSLR